MERFKGKEAKEVILDLEMNNKVSELMPTKELKIIGEISDSVKESLDVVNVKNEEVIFEHEYTSTLGQIFECDCAPLFEFLNYFPKTKSFLRDYVNEFLVQHGFEDHTDFFEVFDLGRRSLEGLTTLKTISHMLVHELLIFEDKTLEDVFKEEVLYENCELHITFKNDEEDDLEHLVYGLQYFPAVRSAMVQQFFEKVVRLWKTPHSQKALIRFLDKPKHYWDSLVRGDTRLLFEDVVRVAEFHGVSVLEFFQTPFCEIYDNGAGFQCSVYLRGKEDFFDEDAFDEDSLPSPFLRKRFSRERVNRVIDSIVESAAQSKEQKSIYVHRILILCMWSYIANGGEGNSNGELCKMLDVPSTAFSRLKQKAILKRSFLEKVVEVFSVDPRFIMNATYKLLGMRLERIEPFFTKVRKGHVKYPRMKEQFLDKILSHTDFNISEAERVFGFGKNAIGRLKNDRTKLSLFWMMRAAVLLEIPVTQILPMGKKVKENLVESCSSE